MQRGSLSSRRVTAIILCVVLLLAFYILAVPGLRGIFATIPEFADRFAVARLFYGAVTLSIILFSVVVYLVLASRVRGHAIAQNMTKELAMSREEFRRLYDEGPVPYMMLSVKGLVRQPNKAALRMFGLPFEKLNNIDFMKLVTSEDETHVAILIERFKRNTSFDREEIRIKHSNGAVRWVMLSAFNVRDPLTNERSGLVTLIDITEQKELDVAKTEFVSLASHQLRGPLATTKWYTEMLATGDLGQLNEQQHEYVGKVQSANEAMVDLVETLLNVSRIEMGTLPVDRKQFDAHELAAGVLDEIKPQVEGKRITLNRNYDPATQTMYSDQRLVRIIFQNLFSNAVKYTPEDGSVTITLEKSGGIYRIVVADTGYGIPPEEQDKIFGKMFRAHNVREMSVDGNGLGLYLVKSIIELLGGTINFVSKVNTGTTFTVTLPA